MEWSETQPKFVFQKSRMSTDVWTWIIWSHLRDNHTPPHTPTALPGSSQKVVWRECDSSCENYVDYDEHRGLKYRLDLAVTYTLTAKWAHTQGFHQWNREYLKRFYVCTTQSIPSVKRLEPHVCVAQQRHIMCLPLVQLHRFCTTGRFLPLAILNSLNANWSVFSCAVHD